MAFHSAVVEHYAKKADGTYPTVATKTFDTVISLGVNFNEGKSADDSNVVIHDYDGNQTKSVEMDDRFLVYANIGAGSSLLFDGSVQSVRASRTKSGSIVTVNLLNRLEKLFNALIPVSSGVTRTANEWIEDVLLATVNQYNTNRTITWHPSNPTLSASYKVEYKAGYQPGFQMLNDMSTPEYTDGYNYDYYLDTSNRLVWQRRTSTITSTLSYGTDFFSSNVDQGIWEIINYIILNAGKDPANYSILQLGFDSESIIENGWKMKVVPEMQIAAKQLSFERTQNPSSWGDTNKYPTAYPYTTTWGTVTTSDATFRSAFRTQVKSLAQNRVSDILRNNKSRTYKNRVDVVPTMSKTLSSLYYINNSFMKAAYSTTGYRIQSISYEYNTDGWSESLQLDEDSTPVI